MKRLLAFVCALMLVLTVCTFYTGTVATVSADAEPAREIVEVSTASALYAALNSADNVGKTVKLTADIDFNPGYTFEYDATSRLIVATNGGTVINIAMDGTQTVVSGDSGASVAVEEQLHPILNGVWLDGDGHTINGFFTGRLNNVVSGFFNNVNRESKVMNLNFTNAAFLVYGTNTSARPDVGVVTPVCYGDIVNVSAEAVIVCDSTASTQRIIVGGIAGQTLPTIANEVAAETAAALISQEENAYVVKTPFVNDCRFYGSIDYYGNSATGSLGGVIGRSMGGEFYNCSNFADLTFSTGTVYACGGVVGLGEPNRGSHPYGAKRVLIISNCANYGDINSGTSKTGAIVGYLDPCWAPRGSQVQIVGCFNGGTISKANGGLYGQYNSGRISYTREGYTVACDPHGGFAACATVGDTAPEAGTARFMIASCVVRLSGGVLTGNIAGTTDPLTAFNRVASFLPYARAWTLGLDGLLYIDYENDKPHAGTEGDPIVISTRADLEELRLAYNGCLSNVGDGVKAYFKLANDIVYNDGEFGFDQTLTAATYTYNDVTYYLGAGVSGLTRGTWYTYDGENYVENAPTLDNWGMLLASGKVGRMFVNIDGDGHEIKGLYVYSTTQDTGFGCNMWGLRFKNLTLSGISCSVNGSAGSFMANARTDCSVTDCTNKMSVISNSIAGGIVAMCGLARGYSGDEFNYERRPDRVPYIAYNKNYGTVFSAANAVRAGGIVGDMPMGQVLFNTNYGTVTTSSTNTASNLYGIGGIVGTCELGTNFTNGTWYGTSVPSGSHKPGILQTYVHIIGNTNLGDVIFSNANRCKGIVGGIDPIWMGEGAVITTQTVENTKVYTVIKRLPSELIVAGNVTVGGVGTVRFQNGSYSKSFFVVGETTLNGTTQTATANEGWSRNAWDTATLTNLASAIAANDDDHFVWIDYTGSQSGIPLFVSRSETGLSITGAGTSASPYVINTKEDLEFFSRSGKYSYTGVDVEMYINEALTETRTVSSVSEAKRLGAYVWHTVGGGKGVLQDGTIGTVASYYASAENAIRYYIAQLDGGLSLSENGYLGLYFKLGADIDWGGDDWQTMYPEEPFIYTNTAETSSTACTPIIGFMGYFDGDGHTLSGLNVINDYGMTSSIFGVLLKSGYIRDLTIADSTVTGTNYVNSLVSYANGNIYGITIASDVTVTGGKNVAGIVGWQQGGLIHDCVNRAAITATAAGNTASGIIENSNRGIYACTNYGNVTAPAGAYGISRTVAQQLGDVYYDLYNYGTITTTQGGRAVGILGRVENIIASSAYADENKDVYVYVSGCENHGTIVGATDAAGIVGEIISCSTFKVGDVTYTRYIDVADCTNYGTVTTSGGVAAGIVGYAKNNNIVEYCANRNTVTSTYENLSDSNLGANGVSNVAGIVAQLTGGATVRYNTNYANISMSGFRGASGIIAAVNSGVSGANVLYNVNYGDVTARSHAAGIVGHSSASNTLIKGNVNYGTIRGVISNNAGIIAWKSRCSTTVCYNINLGDVWGGAQTGGIIGTNNAPVDGYKRTSLYANISIAKIYDNNGADKTSIAGICSNAEGYNMYNYAPDTVIVRGSGVESVTMTGNVLTRADFATGEIAAAINAIDLRTEEAFDAYFENRTYTNWGATYGTEYAVPDGYEYGADVFFQTLGVDAYPTLDDTHDVPAVLTLSGTAPACALENFIAYMDGAGNFYAPGDTVSEPVNVFPLTVNFYTAYGAGVRTSTPTGLRYKTVVDSAFKDVGIDGLFGTFIVPTSYVDACLSEYGEFSAQALVTNSVQKIDVQNSGWYANADTNVYCGSVVRIKNANLNRAYSSVSYLKIEYADGDVAYFSGGYEDSTGSIAAAYNVAANSRTVVAVATAALADPLGGYSAEVRATLQAYIDAAA